MNKGIESIASHYQYTNMLRFLPAILFSFIAFHLPSCQSLMSQAIIWAKNPNYLTAENCARSYLAALTTKDSELEYQCFGSDLKKKYNATLDAYIIARPKLLKDLNLATKYAFNLKIIEKEILNDNEEILWWGLNSEKILFGMHLKRQYYWSLETSRGKYGSLIGPPLKKYISMEGTNINASIKDSIVRSVDSKEAIQSFHVGYEWKIADFLETLEL